MQKKEIQIVTFDNPFPPNYGGVIDVFYKIKVLSEIGVKVYLHLFYDERSNFSELKNICYKVYVYKRKKNIFKFLSIYPYAVNTRSSEALISNLKSINAPVLFESIRTVSLLTKENLTQKTFVRIHNIEHDYCWGLMKSEWHVIKKIAYFFEGLKFKSFQTILKKVDGVFTLSYYETLYYSGFIENKTSFIPVFHDSCFVTGVNGYGTYALYHGDLTIVDNVKSALFLIDVFKDIEEVLIIASSHLNSKLIEKVNKQSNVTFVKIESELQLKNLIKNAHINTLFSYQRSGTKLKVFKALFNGRHCILNRNVIDDLDLLSLCEVAENKIDYQKAVLKLFKTEFVLHQERYAVLAKYNNKVNALNLMKLLG